MKDQNIEADWAKNKDKETISIKEENISYDESRIIQGFFNLWNE